MATRGKGGPSKAAKKQKLPPEPPRPKRVTVVVSYATRGPGFTTGFGVHYRRLRAGLYEAFREDTLDVIGNGMQSSASFEPFEVVIAETGQRLFWLSWDTKDATGLRKERDAYGTGRNAFLKDPKDGINEVSRLVSESRVRAPPRHGECESPKKYRPRRV
jgi:hypothetical protein